METGMSSMRFWAKRSGQGRAVLRQLAHAQLAHAQFALALVALAASGCALVVDTSTEQCEVDGDCAAKGPGFEGLVCTTEKICGRQACTRHSECAERFGATSVCRASDSTCTRTLDDCYRVVPEGILESESAILIGFMGPLQGAFASYGAPLLEGAELALTELETRANGLPAMGDGPRRHLGMLVCHDNDEGEDVIVAEHLAREVQVPAIIGPAFSGVTLRVTTGVTIPAGVLTLSASATSPDITSLGDLVWRTAPSDKIQATPLALLARAALSAPALAPLPGSESARVAMAVRDDSYGNGIADPVFLEMRRLGVSVASDERSLLRINYDPAASAADWSAVVEQISAFRPHVVIGLGTNELGKDLLPGIERTWQDGAPRPKYLLPEGGRVDELIEAVRARPELAQRILGTAPGARRSDAYAAFSGRFRGNYAKAPGNLAEFAYDAAYLLAYAVAIADEFAPAGSELAAALEKVTCREGTNVPAGPDGFTRFFEAAARDGCIDFDGVSGPLDFDSSIGEAPSDIALWCPRHEASGVTIETLPTYYAESSGQFSESTVTFCL